jgi:hypothetical protein
MVCTRIQKALHVENLTVFLRHEESGDYRHAVTLDHRSPHPIVSSSDDLHLPAEAGLIQRLNESGEPLSVDRHELSPSFPQREMLERLNTALLLPLAAKGAIARRDLPRSATRRPAIFARRSADADERRRADIFRAGKTSASSGI